MQEVALNVAIQQNRAVRGLRFHRALGDWQLRPIARAFATQLGSAIGLCRAIGHVVEGRGRMCSRECLRLHGLLCLLLSFPDRVLSIGIRALLRVVVYRERAINVGSLRGAGRVVRVLPGGIRGSRRHGGGGWRKVRTRAMRVCFPSRQKEARLYCTGH